jgi:putative transposase
VGSPAAPGRAGGPQHRREADARARLARHHTSPAGAHHRAGPAGTAGAPDLVKRHFTAARPDELWVADFTYVALVSGRFVYVAFVIDAFAGLIVGWACSTSKRQHFVQSAIRQATALRRRQGHPLLGGTIHHSDAGSQYTALRFGETLVLEGLVPSIGTVADALDNALAETTIGLYKTECIRDGSPFRSGQLTSISDVEHSTSMWVAWYNTERIMHRIGRIPPTEAEAAHYATAQTVQKTITHTN